MSETPEQRAQRFFDETPEPEGTIDELIDEAQRDAAARFAPDENHTSDGRCKYPRDCDIEGRHLTLAEFLLARIGEDEERVKFEGACWLCCDRFIAYEHGGLSCTCGMNERILAECRSKREIMAEEMDRVGPRASFVSLAVADRIRRRADSRGLRALAAIYASHPAYRQEWAA